jgi:hypothetical protein
MRVSMPYEKHSQCGDCDAVIVMQVLAAVVAVVPFLYLFKKKQRLVCERGDVCGAVRWRRR